jgi:hypothetical protein
MKAIKKVVVYYDDNTYEEVGNKAAIFGPVTNTSIVDNPMPNPIPSTRNPPPLRTCCVVCGDPTGHGGMICPKMYPTSTQEAN